MTTARVEYSRMPSMPLNASAALPRGPAICEFRPLALVWAMVRSVVAAADAPFQPFEPRLTGTMVSIALPSVATLGPVTWLAITPATPRNRLASAAAFALSALVRPDGRSYTTTAVKMLGDWNRDCTSSTLVDSALAGSQADALFFSTPVSLPPSGPITATMTSQKTRTAHLVRRPPGMRMIALALLIPRSPFWLYVIRTRPCKRSVATFTSVNVDCDAAPNSSGRPAAPTAALSGAAGPG